MKILLSDTNRTFSFLSAMQWIIYNGQEIIAFYSPFFKWVSKIVQQTLWLLVSDRKFWQFSSISTKKNQKKTFWSEKIRNKKYENGAKFWKFSIFEFYFNIFHHSIRLILESFSGSWRRKSFIRNSGEQKSRKNWIRTETERNRALWSFFEWSALFSSVRELVGRQGLF